MCFIPDLQKALDEFFLKETDKFNDENAEEVINKVKKGEIDVDNLVAAWDKAFTEVSQVPNCSRAGQC